MVLNLHPDKVRYTIIGNLIIYETFSLKDDVIINDAHTTT
jgi:hypothetical protein